MSIDAKKICERFKLFRKKLGLTQQELAKNAGLSRPFVAHVETCKQKPSYEFLLRMVKTYNLSLDWLILGNGQMFQIGQDNILNRISEDQILLLKKIDEFSVEKQSRLIRAFNEIIQED